MKFNKPEFWDKKSNLISKLLLPLTFIVRTIIYLRKKIINPKKFNLPIICVGNIYIGGTGKTPIAIKLASELLKKNKNPVIVRKLHQNHEDEYGVISKYHNLIIKKYRSDSIKEAENMKFDIVILDDGFQDYKIKKDLSLICFNSNQLIGNGLVIPSGPLREDLSAVKNAEIVIINGEKNFLFEEKIRQYNKKISIFYSKYKPIKIERFLKKKLVAIAGIGCPENFFKLLSEYNLNIVKKKVYPDHYKFNKQEFLDIINDAKKNDCEVIMTEKDFFKVKEFKVSGINYLEVQTEIENLEKLIKKILKIYDKKN